MAVLERGSPDLSAGGSLAKLLIRRGGKPGLIRHVGVKVNVLVRAADTSGVWSLIEYTMLPGFEGPPPHWHRSVTEIFYCVSGDIVFTLDGRDVPTSAGDAVVVPPRIVHTMRNDSEAAAVFTTLLTPGGFESYFDEVAELAERSASWPPDPEAFAAIVARSDQHLPPVTE